MKYLSKKYIPLWKSKDSLIIIKGGRGSAKSHTTSLWACDKTYDKGEKILYTRFTLTSAKDSIIPEYKEKIELLNAETEFLITEHEISNKLSGSKILFKGIKTSAGFQTAQLKSIKDPTIWILDEAIEMPDYMTYQKIKRSLRKKGSKIKTVLVLNPESKKHWIYKTFFEKYNIPDYFNGSRNGITYIHTTYLDNLENLDSTFLEDAEKTKVENIEEYENIFLGKWIDESDAIMFPRSELRFMSLSEIDKNQFSGSMFACDFKIEGADYFASLFGFTYFEDVVITDVIFNQDSYQINIPKMISMINSNQIRIGRIESNSAGVIFLNQLRAECTNCSITGIFNKTHKLTRIIMQLSTIKKRFVFLLDKMDYKTEYYKFILFLTSYQKDGKTSIDGKLFDFDDAPDVSAMFATMLFQGAAYAK
jgi:PBSX family phage terminase large subunit